MGLKQVLIALDQLGNTLVGGYADETISARAWRNREKSRFWRGARRVIDAGARVFGQRDHCRWSYVLELNRRQLPPEYRAT